MKEKPDRFRYGKDDAGPLEFSAINRVLVDGVDPVHPAIRPQR